MAQRTLCKIVVRIGDLMSCAQTTQLLNELDNLLAHIEVLMRAYEDTGLYLNMRDDYIALHHLQSRALQQRWAIGKEPTKHSKKNLKEH